MLISLGATIDRRYAVFVGPPVADATKERGRLVWRSRGVPPSQLVWASSESLLVCYSASATADRQSWTIKTRSDDGLVVTTARVP